MKRPLILIDGDGTIWTAPMYRDSKKKVIELLKVLDVDYFVGDDLLCKFFDDLDLKRVKILGLTPERFISSLVCGLYYWAGSRELSFPIKEELELRKFCEESFRITKSRMKKFLLPGSSEAIQSLSKIGDLVLITSGDFTHQKEKFDCLEEKLRKCFSDAIICSLKTERIVKKAIKKHGYEKDLDLVWMIGDGVRSDINSSYKAGVRNLIQISTIHSSWSFEKEEPLTKNLFVVPNLLEAEKIIRTWFDSRIKD